MTEKVYEYIRLNRNGVSPTEIGLNFGKDYNSASSWANNHIKKLIKLGKIERIKLNGKVLYKS